MMTSLVEIETAIKNLPEQDARQLSEWLQTYVADQWDRQIEADLVSGKLEDLIAKAEKDIAENRVKVSALELAGDIVGCVKAPEDLSTNKDYFEGFGE